MPRRQSESGVMLGGAALALRPLFASGRRSGMLKKINCPSVHYRHAIPPGLNFTSLETGVFLLVPFAPHLTVVYIPIRPS